MSKFKVKSGKLNITDPCYTDGTWCALFEMKAKNGIWKAEIETGYEDRVKILRAYHINHPAASPFPKIGEVGVDSGQMSIIDSDSYPKGGDDTGECGDFNNEERVPISFYDECCKATLSEDMFGIVSKYASGAVSSTGLGDGLYNVYGEMDGKELVAVEIVFMDDNFEYCNGCGEYEDECICNDDEDE